MKYAMTLKHGVKRSTVRWSIWIFSALLFFGLPLAANSQSGSDLPRASSSEPDPTSEARTDEGHGVTFSLGQKWRGVISPGRSLYPVYIANPIRPTMAFNRVAVSDSDIAEAGDTRYTLRLGGRVNLVRAHPAGEPDRGFQLDVEAAFLGQFDADHSQDNIGWDGIWGLALTWADGTGLAAKLATQHDSSHVGDEYTERTGRKRINYTRAEVVFGLSLAFFTQWRVYGEAGYAYDMRNVELQEPWRVEGGLELKMPTGSGKDGWGTMLPSMLRRMKSRTGTVISPCRPGSYYPLPVWSGRTDSALNTGTDAPSSGSFSKIRKPPGPSVCGWTGDAPSPIFHRPWMGQVFCLCRAFSAPAG